MQRVWWPVACPCRVIRNLTQIKLLDACMFSLAYNSINLNMHLSLSSLPVQKCAASLSTTEPANLYAAADPTTVARSIPLLCASSSRPVPPTSSTRRSSATTSPADQQDDALCLERIRTGSYLCMAPHPDGSSLVFLWTQDGKVSVASAPKRGSRRALRVDNIPILDLTARAAALMGVAFHREFATNGRFFVSYACDSASPACAATTSAAAAGNGSRSTRYLLVVDEFSVNSGGHNYSKVNIRHAYYLPVNR